VLSTVLAPGRTERENSGNRSFPQLAGVYVTQRLLLAALAALSVSAPLHAGAQDETAPSYINDHRTTADDTAAIERVLRAYTTSVSTADEATFESLLLNEEVPFTSTDELVAAGANAPKVDTRRYSRFRKSVFENAVQYTQHFYNVHIQQDGDLAQVSLDFVTKAVKKGGGGFGWKTLQLVKIKGQWKIASEIYTVRDLPPS
jgi:ketosteroid isomerase-like protein